jgi:MFS family permease
MCVVGLYMNIQFAFMLKDPTMFNVPEEEIGGKTSNLASYSIPFTMLSLFFISYAFELLGRRWTLFLSFFLTSFLFFMLPRTSPSYTGLMIVRCIIAITMAGPIAHPLVADYVHVRSRGKMIAITGIGVVVGEVLSMSIFQLQNVLQFNYYSSFTQIAGLLLFMSFYFLWAIKDPNFNKIHRSLSEVRMSGEY